LRRELAVLENNHSQGRRYTYNSDLDDEVEVVDNPATIVINLLGDEKNSPPAHATVDTSGDPLLRGEDRRRLEPKGWYSDGIVSWNLKYIAEHPKEFNVEQAMIYESWLIPCLKINFDKVVQSKVHKNTMAKKFIVIPYHWSEHWSLVIVVNALNAGRKVNSNADLAAILHFCSLGNNSPSQINKLNFS
jgi:Ulp1 family protease